MWCKVRRKWFGAQVKGNMFKEIDIENILIDERTESNGRDVCFVYHVESYIEKLEGHIDKRKVLIFGKNESVR